MDAEDTAAPSAAPAPWLTVRDAAAYCQCGPRLIYRAAAAGQLRVARIGGRRDLRLKAAWLDAWLEASAAPVEIGR